MQDDWIIDVLDDLAEFARLNRLEELVLELARTRQVALVELSAGAVLAAGGGARSAGSLGAHTGNLSERQGS